MFSIESIKEDKKDDLINALSISTNSQSPVSEPDRNSCNPIILNYQKRILSDYGFFF